MIKYSFKGLLLLLFGALCYQCTPSTTHNGNTLKVAFYNVENLFDTIDDPTTRDEEFLPQSPKKWTSTRYNSKINHLSRVLKAIFDDQKPDLLGLCEVENKQVTTDLAEAVFGRSGEYDIVQFDSPDFRGIDNVLIYQKGNFHVLQTTPIHLYFSEEPSLRTRDILYVKGLVDGMDTLHVFINHFPSRSGGLKESERLRIAVAEKLRHKVDSLLFNAPENKILIMGDFNDEPSNISISQVLKATANDHLKDGELFDVMAKYDEQGKGSYLFRDEWEMLDQFILSVGLLENQGLHFVHGSEGIFVKDWMLQDESAGKYQGYPWRTYAGNKYLDGYSDHLPIYLTLSLNEKTIF